MADNEPEKSNFIQIYRECFAAALHDSLDELHFRDFPSAEAYLIAERTARSRTDEYVQRRLSPDEYQKYQATDKALKTIVSIGGATGMEQILYWAEKLGICAPDDDVEHIVDRVRRYCVAEHGLFRHQFDELDVYQVADILKLDAKAKGLGKPDETTPGAGQGDERAADAPAGAARRDRRPTSDSLEGYAPTETYETVPFVPSANDWLVLRALDSAKHLMKQADLEAATEELGTSLSRRTIGPILQKLQKLNIVEFPNGERSGARLTAAGRTLVQGDEPSH